VALRQFYRKKCVFSKKRGNVPTLAPYASAVRFERHNQFFEETFGTVYPHFRNIEKMQKVR